MKWERASQVSVEIPETCGAVQEGRVGPGRTWTQESLQLQGRAGQLGAGVSERRVGSLLHPPNICQIVLFLSTTQEAKAEVTPLQRGFP